jgi:hypothetical protein
MTVQFMVTVEIDDASVEREGQRHGYSLEKAREAVLCSAIWNADSWTHRDGVTA